MGWNTTKVLPQNTRTEKDSSKSSGMRMGSMLYHRGYLRMRRKRNGLLLGCGKEFKALFRLIVSQFRNITTYVNRFSKSEFGIDVEVHASLSCNPPIPYQHVSLSAINVQYRSLKWVY